MKKFIALSLLIMTCLKLQAQTQFPFYGFELSNYEVGDTLEYYYSYNSFEKGSHEFNLLFEFVKKDTYGNDSIRYTTLRHDNLGNSIDTILSTVTNDTIYNNDNNFLDVKLVSFDTIMKGYDSAYFKYDTLSGLKRINLKLSKDGGYIKKSYSAIENIGIIEWHQFSIYPLSDGDKIGH